MQKNLLLANVYPLYTHVELTFAATCRVQFLFLRSGIHVTSSKKLIPTQDHEGPIEKIRYFSKKRQNRATWRITMNFCDTIKMNVKSWFSSTNQTSLKQMVFTNWRLEWKRPKWIQKNQEKNTIFWCKTDLCM